MAFSVLRDRLSFLKNVRLDKTQCQRHFPLTLSGASLAPCGGLGLGGGQGGRIPRPGQAEGAHVPRERGVRGRPRRRACAPPGLTSSGPSSAPPVLTEARPLCQGPLELRGIPSVINVEVLALLIDHAGHQSVDSPVICSLFSELSHIVLKNLESVETLNHCYSRKQFGRPLDCPLCKESCT